MSRMGWIRVLTVIVLIAILIVLVRMHVAAAYPAAEMFSAEAPASALWTS